ncbi:MAG: SDR family NAD(P)-dependent oxidoreductase [Pseudomonadota bacterium]
MGRLTGKVAVVVGGGQTPGETMGNGRATALRFAEEGAQVAVLDMRLDSAQETVEMILSAGGDARAYALDITREDDCRQIVAQVIKDFGRIDVLHNNVGIGVGDAGPLRVTAETWDRLFATNVRGIMFMCQAVVPHMREQGRGAITSISSVAAVCSAANIVAYKASKAALNAYSHALAMNNARHGIRANIIMPGLMHTPMAIEGYVAAGQVREELIARRDAAVPLGAKMGTAWDVANAALFLASDEAGFITGVELPVDGGQSAKIG